MVNLGAQKIAIISNPQSGYNRRKGMKKLNATITKNNLLHIEALTQNDISLALEQLAQQNPDILIINGGDGTVDMVVRLIRNKTIFTKEPILALLKGGTTNLIHRDVGLKQRPDKALKRILKNRFQILKRRPLKIHFHSDNKKNLYGFFMGTGALPRATDIAKKKLHSKGMRGQIGEFLMLISVLLRLRFKRNLEDDIILHTSPIVINDTQKQHILFTLTSLQRLIPGISSKASTDTIGGIYVDAKRRAMEQSQHKNLHLKITQPWVLDGEIQEPGEIDIQMDKALKFLVA